MKFAVAVFLLAAAVQVYALPGGAPAAACINIFPVGHSPAASANPVNQVANPTDITATPYQLSLQGFRYYIDMQTPGYRYYPGVQYYRKCYNLFSSAMGPQRFSICEYLLYNRFAFEPDLGRLFFVALFRTSCFMRGGIRFLPIVQSRMAKPRGWPRSRIMPA